ncbi:MAG: MATE family efflux transporter [Aristaeellaceae bacterium]
MIVQDAMTRGSCRMEKDLTTGSVWKNILAFSLPYFLSYLLQTLYGMADLYIIGRFGSVAETTAVAIGSQVMHMLTVMIVGLAMGATVFIGQSVGGNDRSKAAGALAIRCPFLWRWRPC